MGPTVGDRVRVTAPGAYTGLIGEVTARRWALDLRDVQLDAGGEVPFRPDELEVLPDPDPRAKGHAWDHDEGGAYCKRCGGFYQVWYDGTVHGYTADPIEQDCPGHEVAHGADFGAPGYNPACDCRTCG